MKGDHEQRKLDEQSGGSGPGFRPSEADYRRTAKRLHEEEGTLEIDEGALVSIGDVDQGAYVQCWVWVPRESVEPER